YGMYSSTAGTGRCSASTGSQSRAASRAPSRIGMNTFSISRIDLDQPQLVLLAVPHELGVEAAVVVAHAAQVPLGEVDHPLLHLLGHGAGRVVQAREARARLVLVHVEHAVDVVLAAEHGALGRHLGALHELLGEAGVAAGALELGRQLHLLQ